MSFVLSKILWGLANPANAFTLLLLCGAFASVARGEWWRRAGRRLCFALALMLFLIAVLPVGHWLLLPLEDRFPPVLPDHVDGIVLLGGDENPALTEERQQPVVEISARRYVKFVELAHAYPAAKLAFVGGSNAINPSDAVTPAQIAKTTLTGFGIPDERVVYEDKSRNTYENAVFATNLIKPQPGENWLLVTSANHMPRAMGCFRKAGWRVFPAPTDYRSAAHYGTRISFDLLAHANQISVALHEYTGLVAYRLMGRIERVWP